MDKIVFLKIENEKIKIENEKIKLENLIFKNKKNIKCKYCGYWDCLENCLEDYLTDFM